MTANTTRNTKNRTLAISSAPAATPVNPNRPAMAASTRKIKAHLSSDIGVLPPGCGQRTPAPEQGNHEQRSRLASRSASLTDVTATQIGCRATSMNQSNSPASIMTWTFRAEPDTRPRGGNIPTRRRRTSGRIPDRRTFLMSASSFFIRSRCSSSAAMCVGRFFRHLAPAIQDRAATRHRPDTSRSELADNRTRSPRYCLTAAWRRASAKAGRSGRSRRAGQKRTKDRPAGAQRGRRWRLL